MDHHPPLEALQETGGLLALQDLDLPIETHDRVISHGPGAAVIQLTHAHVENLRNIEKDK